MDPVQIIINYLRGLIHDVAPEMEGLLLLLPGVVFPTVVIIRRCILKNLQGNVVQTVVFAVSAVYVLASAFRLGTFNDGVTANETTGLIACTVAVTLLSIGLDQIRTNTNDPDKHPKESPNDPPADEPTPLKGVDP